MALNWPAIPLRAWYTTVRPQPGAQAKCAVVASSQSLNVRRGLIAAALSACGGAAACFALTWSILLVKWWVMQTPALDRRYDADDLSSFIVYPAVGCAFAFACAGWATFAPRGRWRFARTLALVVLVPVAIWVIVSCTGLFPHRLRKHAYFPDTSTEVVVFIALPIIATAVVTIRRMRVVSNDPGTSALTSLNQTERR